MAEKRLEDMLWKNILRIKSESDEQFARYVLEARSEFLRLRLRQEPALRKIYLDAADRVAEEIRRLKPTIGPLTRNHLKALEKSLRAEADRISQAITKKLEEDLPLAVKAGASPLQRQLMQAVQDAGVPLSVWKIQRGFGDVNARAVEAIWARTRNGMKLSDRIWEKGAEAREAIRSIIWDGTARGRDAVKIARDIEKYARHGRGTLTQDYPNMMARMGKRIPKNLSYEALRLARTEMTMAFQEGTYAAGRVNPSYRGVRWMLSSGHPFRDVCDDLAEADLYGLGPGGYPAGEEPITPHPNCLCYQIPLVENTGEFVGRLKRWLRDPGSEPDLEKWYNEFWLGQLPQQRAIAVSTSVPARQQPKRRTGLLITEWKSGIRKLAGKKGPELDAAVDALRQRFRSAFQADLEFDSGFLQSLSQRVKGNKLRKAVMELVEALNRMPIEATRDNPMFAKLRIGGTIGAWGDFQPVTGVIRIDAASFAAAPEWATGRLSHAYETLIHEIGHAAHKAEDAYFRPWVNEMWDLSPLRSADLWSMSYYKNLAVTGTPKDWSGITLPNGASDPLEDFADTWRLLYVEPNATRQQQVYATFHDPKTGAVAYGPAHRRYRLLHQLISQKGWRVPPL